MKLLRRVSRLLISPRSEWPIIDAERDEVASICWNYIAVLALVPAVSVLSGLALMDGRFLGFAGITTAITATMVTWVIALGSSVASAVVIEKLAPVFDADGDMTQGLKVVAYSSTPIWLAGVGNLFAFPTWPLFVMGAIWAVYLLYLGLPIVMKTPQRRVVSYVLASVLTVIVANVVMRVIFTTFGVPYY